MVFASLISSNYKYDELSSSRPALCRNGFINCNISSLGSVLFADIIFGPIGAATVDLLSRRKILIITNFLQAAIIFSYIFINQQSIFILYAVVLLYSLLNQFYVPAESAYLPSTVASVDLAQANSIFFITIQASLILGFGFAGVLQRLISFNGVLILCSTFFILGLYQYDFLA